LLGIGVTFVGIFGAYDNVIDDWYPTQYRNFIRVSLAGTIIGMIALFLAVIDNWYHKKELVIGAMLLLALGWILVFAGMIIGA